MTMPVEEIEVECPGCGKTYTDWHRASLNLDIEDFSDEYIDEATSVCCPFCHLKVRLEALIVKDKGFHFVLGGAMTRREP